jgi:limonene-1,2-epoxide hydrolase
MVTLVDTRSKSATDNNRVGTIESILSGVASGLIAIPKGFFSLGGTLLDLGVDQNRAARVEQFFDDLTEFDEKAEATAAGRITEALVNIGIPAVRGMKIGAQLADDAMRASRNGKYFKTTNSNLKTAIDKATELNARGNTNKFIAGALGGGVAEAVFVGDVEQLGTFGDFVGGPTAIDRSTDDDPTRELLNRVKFGTEGALFTGVIGGAGKVVKKLTDRNKQLDVANSKLDAFIDKIASGFRARSGKTQEFFGIERTSIGERAADAAGARNISKELDQAIDKVFPPMRTVLNQAEAAKRKQMLTKINDLLLSGDPKLDDLGVATFGKLDEAKKATLVKELKDLKVDNQVITDILGSLSTIRTRWSDLFSKLGRSLGQNEIKEFKTLFGNKFKNYIGSTYDIFQNQSIFPWVRYKPVKESVDEAKEVFKSSAREAGEELTDLQAEQAVTRVLRTARLPKGIRMDKPSDAIFEVPNFFVNRTTLDEVVTARGSALVSAGAIKEADRKVFEKLLGKQQNPMQTILGGTAKLSMITRRNLFFQDLISKNKELVAAGKKPMFVETADEARLVFGDDFQQIRIDQAKTLSVAAKGGSINPLNELYTTKGMADALENTSLSFDKAGMLGQLYQSLILYPKGLSQIAKTILSPVTHVRNFVSAGAFATANGIIPDGQAIKTAYQALQTPLKGTRQQNDLYEELLKLGVVNSNVRLGDLTRLLEDVNFGETMTSDKGLRLLLKPLSKLKSVSQDLYTAEDDFWKIASWAMEKTRLEKALANKGVTRGMTVKRNGVDTIIDEQFFKEEAADIVRNNIPNYDYVSEFVKSLRKLPIGNFVSFPAEIVRTGTNIVRRGLREINETFELADGTVIKPFAGIGHTRLFGFGATVAAVPYATQKAFQAIYDVTDEEREAIRRYVADWSKNSTLLPIKNKDGSFKYVDFSHANAYDTLIRPVQTIINSVADGRTDEDGLMDDFIAGTFSSMSEFAQPFISESIWTEAVADLLARGGRTRDGFQVFNPQDLPGDKAYKIMGHLVKAQMPFSFEQLKRLDRSIESVDILQKGKFDKYGQTFEFGDEFAGLFGFRSVSVNPERSLNFKIADYQRGVRQSRQLFTREALRGGPIEPRDVVDAYINANRSLFGVRQEFKKDIDAARILGISEDGFRSSVGRLSGVEINTIDNNVFRPINISPDIRRAFAQNAAKIGEVNPLETASNVISNVRDQMRGVSLQEPNFPFIENPLLPSAQETPVTPTSLNLPAPDTAILANSGAGSSFNNLTTAQKLAILFNQN